MSSTAVYETEISAEHIARGINSDFQFIADRLPTEVKEAAPDEVFTLCDVEGIGVLWAKYAGACRSTSGEAIMEFKVRIGMHAVDSAVQLGFSKDFGLTYQTLHQPGQLTDLEPIHGEDLRDCPVSLGVLAFLTQSMREKFATDYSDALEHTEDIVQLDIHRAA